MATVSSIRHHDITNDYNDGANSLKNFLHYAEAVSKGDEAMARRVLENLNPLSRKALSPLSKGDAVVEGLAAALRERGHVVDLNVGQSKFRCDLAVRSNSDNLYQLGILVDTDGHYANSNLLDRYLMQPSILRAFGWRFALVLTKDWYHSPDDVLSRLQKLLEGRKVTGEVATTEDEPAAVEPVSMPEPEPTVTPLPPPPPPHAEAPPMPAPPILAATGTRRFQFVGGSSRKFWQIAVSGSSFTVRFGRLGTTGQSQTKSFADDAKARHEADQLIAEKVKKGYVEERGT